MTRSGILFSCALIFSYPCHLRAKLLGAATQKVKPRRVAASEAGAERVSKPQLLSFLQKATKKTKTGDSGILQRNVTGSGSFCFVSAWQDHSTHPVLKNQLMNVDQQSDRNIQQFHVAK